LKKYQNINHKEKNKKVKKVKNLMYQNKIIIFKKKDQNIFLQKIKNQVKENLKEKVELEEEKKYQKVVQEVKEHGVIILKKFLENMKKIMMNIILIVL